MRESEREVKQTRRWKERRICRSAEDESQKGEEERDSVRGYPEKVGEIARER